MSGHTRDEELDMMSHPDKWPHLFVLPLKRPDPGGGWPELGFLKRPAMVTLAPAPEPVVHLGAVWSPRKGDRPVAAYDSLEAVLDDGWVVD
jgi:hypothetical protein